MKNNFLYLFISFFLLLALQPVFAATEPVTVKVGAFNNYPVIFRDTDGVFKGMYVDLLTEIGKRENINFEYVLGTWNEGLDRIKTGEVEMLTSVGFTEERAQFMDYTKNPILTVWGRCMCQSHQIYPAYWKFRVREWEYWQEISMLKILKTDFPVLI